jgi:hypothetical protein
MIILYALGLIVLWFVLVYTLILVAGVIGWPHEYLAQWVMAAATVICGIVAAAQAQCKP